MQDHVIQRIAASSRHKGSLQGDMMVAVWLVLTLAVSVHLSSCMLCHLLFPGLKLHALHNSRFRQRRKNHEGMRRGGCYRLLHWFAALYSASYDDGGYNPNGSGRRSMSTSRNEAAGVHEFVGTETPAMTISGHRRPERKLCGLLVPGSQTKSTAACRIQLLIETNSSVDKARA